MGQSGGAFGACGFTSREQCRDFTGTRSVQYACVTENQMLSPYAMFRYSIQSELTRKYYERRLRKFLDFIEFETGTKEIEKRCESFAEKGKTTTGQ